MSDDGKKLNFAQSINKLEEINNWFQNEDIDLDEGLKKLKEGKELITQCRSKLQEVENEFVKIKADFTEEVPVGASDEEEIPAGNGVTETKPVETDDVPF